MVIVWFSPYFPLAVLFLKYSARTIQTTMPTTNGTALKNDVDGGALYPAYLIPQSISQYARITRKSFSLKIYSMISWRISIKQSIVLCFFCLTM